MVPPPRELSWSRGCSDGAGGVQEGLGFLTEVTQSHWGQPYSGERGQGVACTPRRTRTGGAAPCDGVAQSDPRPRVSPTSWVTAWPSPLCAPAFLSCGWARAPAPAVVFRKRGGPASEELPAGRAVVPGVRGRAHAVGSAIFLHVGLMAPTL